MVYRWVRPGSELTDDGYRVVPQSDRYETVPLLQVQPQDPQTGTGNGEFRRKSGADEHHRQLPTNVRD